MKESAIESHLIKRVKQLGGFTRKVVYQGRKGSPDRWNFFDNALLIIIELKKPGEKPEPQQVEEIAALSAKGFNVRWTDSKEGVDAIFKEFGLL